MEPFVDIDWLNDHRDQVVLVDIRWYIDGRPGRPEYERRHLPGAVFLELDEVLSAPHEDDRQGRHPFPSPERFADGLGALGIGDHEAVVAYEDAGGVIAARLVWMLRATGHDAALLDGGLNAWAAASGAPLEAGPAPVPTAKHFTPVPWPDELIADIDTVAAAAVDGRTVLIDARDRRRFAGGPDPVDPKSGHIPGARNVPTREHLDSDGRIASPEQLRETFAQAGIEPGSEVISYCGSGVTACHNLLALELAGLGPARLYPGSWSQWSRDPARPVATGEA
jgi:thiosulfate/3-mercaptopyruvate sulfurtransferase